MKEYNTEQRTALLEYFKMNRNRQVSVDDMLNELPENFNISRSAIYRNIDKMLKDGHLRKAAIEGSRKAVYQYVECGNHCDKIHLHCEKCGKVFHVEESVGESICKLLEKSGFKLDEHETIMNGICRDCLKK